MPGMLKKVVVSGSFDRLDSRQMRFLEEAAKLGRVCALLWSDTAVKALLGHPPDFPLVERLYLLQSVRYLERVEVVEDADIASLFAIREGTPDVWAVPEWEDQAEKCAFCSAMGIEYQVIPAASLREFQTPSAQLAPAKRRKVIITGCYDWLHSGHVRFFEEVSALGDLYVAVGNDANVRNLKGDGHPLFSQAERCYMVASIRYVHQALITSGWGWLDAEPEIARLHPDVYAVNEDGNKPEKRAFCQQHGIEYVVLQRLPKPGLPRRQSTDLRGF